MVYNHPQFFLIRILNNSFRRSILVAFMYGSPNKKKRKMLWEGLNLGLPNENIPWIAIGGSNAIFSPRSGGDREEEKVLCFR